MPLGFILHPTYFIERGRPVVHLFGRLETGETMVVRDDRTRPHFFVRTRELPAAGRVLSLSVQETVWTTPSGEPVSRVFASVPPEIPRLRDSLEGVGIRTYEADIPFVTRFLIEAGIRGAAAIEGPFRPGRLVGRIYQNPDLAPAEWSPPLSVLALDIETDPTASRCLSIALWGDEAREVLVVAPDGVEAGVQDIMLDPGEPKPPPVASHGPAGMEGSEAGLRGPISGKAAQPEGSGRADGDLIQPEASGHIDGDPIQPEVSEATSGGPRETAKVLTCPDEKTLLERLTERLRALDPDVLTGWNVIDFDLRVLQKRFDANRVPFEIGRAEVPCRLLLDRTAWGASRAIVPGRVVLDGLSLLRSAFVRLEDYRLETAAREILGRGKLIASSEGKAEEILRLYHEDLPAFLRYNLNDARLVHEILAARRLVDLAVRQSLLTGMPPDRVGASIASFDFLYLSELHRRRQVAPTVDASRPPAPTMGGFVLSPIPGIYDHVAVLDYRSLYPSIIRTFRLDPLSLIEGESRAGGRDHAEAGGAVAGAGGRAGDGAGGLDRAGHDAGDRVTAEAGGAAGPPILAPNGARFRREGGILPELLDRLFPLRAASIDRGDGLTATALKILMNSFYGVLATPRCRFYSPETANAITGFGQQILLWTREAIESRGRRVLYGDTDSIFVETGAASPEEAEEAAARLAGEIDVELAERLRRLHGVESRLHLRFDRLFRKLLLPARRGSSEGSMKRYAGLAGPPGGEGIVFVGLETVRRDWTEASKILQRELIARAFRGEPVEPFIRDFLARVRRGDFDRQLVYRKALRKPEGEYLRSTPAHVQAARLERRPSGRIIRYVVTTEGPEPADDPRHPLDREHYVEKQLRPVAEPILALLGTSWDRVAGSQGLLPF